jgi:hypothetical protein
MRIIYPSFTCELVYTIWDTIVWSTVVEQSHNKAVNLVKPDGVLEFRLTVVRRETCRVWVRLFE